MTDMKWLETARTEYVAIPGELSQDTVPNDPIALLRHWYQQAESARVPEPGAMTLATVDDSGIPSARIVLLKAIEGDGLLFFTNYNSPKSRDIQKNSNVALVFYWPTLHRQVRVCGPAERVDRTVSESYFSTRPRASQVGAWASRQSDVLASRAGLDERVAECERRYAGTEVPTPPDWGGYRVIPTVFEFWQGQTARLHDRFRYIRTGGSGWRIERLFP